MLFKILGAPFTLPAAGMKFILDQLADLADQELDDENALREELLLLQVQFEEGDVDDDEYVEREAALMVRLRAIKARKLPAEANVEARRRIVVDVDES